MDIAGIKTKLERFFKKEKRMPSYRELAKLAGYASSQAAVRLADKLIDLGVLGKSANGSLVPGSMFQGVRKLGIVEAGFPTQAEEDMADALSLDEWLIEKPESTFMLTVKGDSMKDAGINEGDVVIVERRREAKLGEIVIARLDGGYTMKYLRQDRQGYYLEAANTKYKPFRPSEDLNIEAVVKAVIRKY